MKLELSKLCSVILLNICILVTLINSASAHRVNVFAWVDGETIHVESKFSGGKKVKAGKVVVMDPRGIELLTGDTNDQGEYSFTVPQPSDLRIIIMAGQGHQGEWTVRETELQGLEPQVTPKTDVSLNMSSAQKNDDGKISADPRAAIADNSIQPKELEVIIESVLDRKLQPITRMLADMRQEGPSVSDIFAGIGYIVGLVGIAAYVQNRKKKA